MSYRNIAMSIGVGAVVAALVGTATTASAVYPNFSLTTNNPAAAVSTAAPINYRASQSAQIVLRDNTGTTTSFVCAASSNSFLKGTVQRGLNRTGPTVGTVKSTTLGTATYNSGTNTFNVGSTPCTFGGGVPLAVQQVGTWNINVTGASTPTGSAPVANQQTPLTVTNIRARFVIRTQASPPAVCGFDIGGTATNYGTSTSPVSPSPGNLTASYKNGSTSTTLPTLSIVANSGNLHAFNAPPAGCALGAIKSGDAFSIEGGSGSPAPFRVNVDNTTMTAPATTNPAGTADQLWLSV